MAATALAIQAVPHAGLLPVAYSTPTQTTANVNTDCEGVNPHNETSIAVNPTNPLNIVATPAGAAAPGRRCAAANGDNWIPVPADVYADPVTGLCTFDLGAGFATATIAAERSA